MPLASRVVLTESLPYAVTGTPKSAKHAATTVPRYPQPKTPICIKSPGKTRASATRGSEGSPLFLDFFIQNSGVVIRSFYLVHAQAGIRPCTKRKVHALSRF